MKKFITIICCLLLALGSFSLKAQRIYYDAVASGLLGHVKEETSYGFTSRWNKDGSFADENFVIRNEHMLPTKISSQWVYSVFTYDNHKRLKESATFFNNKLSQKEEYRYASDYSFLPETMIVTYPDGESVIQKYKYTKIDDHGNWTECVTTLFRRGKESTSKHTRTITYWE